MKINNLYLKNKRKLKPYALRRNPSQLPSETLIVFNLI